MKPMPPYKTEPVIDYQLTEAERRVITWLRTNTNGRANWAGTIQYYYHTNVIQMTNHVKAGQVKR